MLKTALSVALLGSLVACGPVEDSGSRLFSRVRDDLKEKVEVRFVQGDLPSGNLDAILSAVNAARGTSLTPDMFVLTEERELFSSLYRRYALSIDSVPVEKSSIRVWLDRRDHRPMQVEVRLQPIPPKALFQSPSLPNDEAELMARNIISREKPNEKLESIRGQYLWVSGRLVRRVVAIGLHGKFEFDFANDSPRLITRRYRPFGRSDAGGELSFTAPLYKIWEWANNGNTFVKPSELQPLSLLPVRNLLTTIPAVDPELIEKARASRYSSSKKKMGALTPGEIADGYWNSDLLESLYPLRFFRPGLTEANDFSSPQGVRLFGKNAIVMLDPDATKFVDASNRFSPAPSFAKNWDNETDTFNFSTPWWNKGARSESEFARVALDDFGSPRMDDPAWLLHSGFDELQVYYAIDTFMESMRGLGFEDPDLSTRQFSALLFNPSIEDKDNAFCSGDTVHFTTYSKDSVNYARDNTTIWHELGHGVMDRVMGSFVDATEGYGLWEGIADYVAEVMVTHEAGRADFMNRKTMRIVNSMWLYNSNESHDDGESYGGAMYDLLQRVMDRFGVEEGLLRTNDLVFETMRLTRDLEELTPVEWFEHMKYADKIDRISSVPSRKAGELQNEIAAALAGRNYGMGAKPARFLLQRDGKDILDGQEGSREKPIPVKLGERGRFSLVVKVEDGSALKFAYPVRVEIAFSGGALQGAAHWRGEERGSRFFKLRRSGAQVSIPVTVDGTCDDVNTSSGGCKDFVYVQIYNRDSTPGKPVGKKRFYVELQ